PNHDTGRAEVDDAVPAAPPERVVQKEEEKLGASYSSVEPAAEAGPATSASAEAADRDPIPQSAREIAEARLAALSREAGGDDPETEPGAEPGWEPGLADETPAEGVGKAEGTPAPPQAISQTRKEESNDKK